MRFAKISLKPYIALLRLDKPIGIFLLLWPTLVALWQANIGAPSLELISIFVLGSILMRSAGCVINDYFDSDLDRQVSRTKSRPLANQSICKKHALILFIILIFLAALLLLRLNLLTFVLACVAVLLVVIYPLMKRVSNIPQLSLGITFAISVPMAFAASEAVFSSQVLLLYITTIVWALIYDSQYAMADRVDDLKIGIKSSAILFANYDRLIIALLQFLMLALLLFMGRGQNYISVVIIALLFVYQQVLIKDRNASNCLRAFKNNNLVGMVWFAGVLS